MRLVQNINQSIDAVRANSFRAGVTIFIIALGITCLIGVLTSIEGVKYGMLQSFSRMGTNTFNIQNWGRTTQTKGRGRNYVSYPPITYRQSQIFKERFRKEATVSVRAYGTGVASVSYKSNKTNNTIQIVGSDENYPKTARYVIEEGRNLTPDDIRLGKNVAVIGAELKKRIFPNESPIGKTINANNHVYKVVGLFEEIGATSGSGGDKVVVIPLTTLRRHYPYHGSLTLDVFSDDPSRLDFLMDEAVGEFRVIRQQRLDEPENFSVRKSDAFVGELMENLSVLTISAKVIALITLLGASVALLNVMLVSVTERTNEIGLRKAMGATKKNILSQFLIEAIVICQFGGALGILLGLFVGNILSTLAFNAGFVVPWSWVIVGVIACFAVGIGAGYYPARRAARVDPIESLRHI
ncbi:MAG: ABC transporter permease [Bacteroidota bacterium]